MKRLITILFVTSISLLPGNARGAAPEPGTSSAAAPFDIVKTNAFTIAVPAGWTAKNSPNDSEYKMLRRGHGREVPNLDETFEPIEVGITVECPAWLKGSLQDGAQWFVDAEKKNKGEKIIGEPKMIPSSLNDGTESLVLLIELYTQGDRHSLRRKVITKDKDGKFWVITDYLVAGKESTWPTPSSAIEKWMQPFSGSFVFDPAKFSTAALPGRFKVDNAVPSEGNKP